jgi:hypothetical protein
MRSNSFLGTTDLQLHDYAPRVSLSCFEELGCHDLIARKTENLSKHLNVTRNQLNVVSKMETIALTTQNAYSELNDE